MDACFTRLSPSQRLVDTGEESCVLILLKAAAPLVERIKTALGDKVKDVRVSNRLVDSTACLVVDEYDMSLQMQRLFQAATASQPTLEINPEHALLERLQDAPVDGARTTDYATLLFEQAMLAEGGSLDDPAAFVARMSRLLVS